MQIQQHRSRFSILILTIKFYIIISFLVRFFFTIQNLDAVLQGSFWEASYSILTIFLQGLLYDLSFSLYAIIPALFYLWLMPNKWWQSKANRIFISCFLALLFFCFFFTTIAEYFFWNEYHTRFNFIAVNYLIYPHEVTTNIKESYPVFPLMFLCSMLAVLFLFFLRKPVNYLLHTSESFLPRTLKTLSLFILIGLLYFTVGQAFRERVRNTVVRELSSNGPYQFIAAFRNNEINYPVFYKSLPSAQVTKIIRNEVQTPNSKFLPPRGEYDTLRHIENKPVGTKPNLIIIMVESLSASYMKYDTPANDYTPYLDELTKKSLFFNKLYAVGTRTVRGMEAAELSIPPTPGRSIIKRIGREKNLYSLGSILKDNGYKNYFLYSGHGFFDNMNSFFSGNGYETIDQMDSRFHSSDFHTAWGYADEYLFDVSLKQANKLAAQKQPFSFFIMTVSNHRPFLYPKNALNEKKWPQGERESVVTYTDKTIHDFLENAKKEPWFNNTIFVIVADHNAHSDGKLDLPLARYHIPLYMYAPKLIKPQIIDTVGSQIDIAPTVLHLLGISYTAPFYGKDLLTLPKEKGRALIGTYQKLGFFQGSDLAILAPQKGLSLTQNADKPLKAKNIDITTDNITVQKTISYYQSAYYLYKRKLYYLNNKK